MKGTVAELFAGIGGFRLALELEARPATPAHQRGRDSGVMLRCLADLGCAVEWRVANAAGHGSVQRRRRTFAVALALAAGPADTALAAAAK